MMSDLTAHNGTGRRNHRMLGFGIALFAAFLFVAPIVAKWFGWLPSPSSVTWNRGTETPWQP